jgi:hypothetical protein
LGLKREAGCAECDGREGAARRRRIRVSLDILGMIRRPRRLCGNAEAARHAGVLPAVYCARPSRPQANPGHPSK